MTPDSHPAPASHRRALRPWALALLSVIAIVIWIAKLGWVLVNDEYAALDYAFRSLHLGGFDPTPHRLHKPLAVLTALLVLPAGPLGYELRHRGLGRSAHLLLLSRPPPRLGRGRGRGGHPFDRH